MNNIRRINKQEAARRQLDSAIEWFFEGGDLLPIFNVGSSVFVMTENLAKKQNIETTFYGVMRSGLEDAEFKALKEEMGEKHGFLKHGDRDKSDIFDVNDKQAAAILYFAAENYMHLFKEETSQMALIRAFLYSSLTPDQAEYIGVNKEYLKGIENFVLIAKQEGLLRLKEVLGLQLTHYKKLKNGSDRSVRKIKTT